MAQVAASVPKRVRFQKLDYNGKNKLVIKGDAFSDQDILKLIENLNKQKLIAQASLSSMVSKKTSDAAPQMKGFTVQCVLRGGKS